MGLGGRGLDGWWGWEEGVGVGNEGLERGVKGYNITMKLNINTHVIVCLGWLA